ncbi:MAG: septation protein A [Hyphomicrobiaceae bacterium]|nr:septation protein A [Hyphomicrobiaceae bacterium]
MSQDQAAPAKSVQSERGQLLKLALEIAPLVVFFAVNGYRGILWGTGAFMAATIVSLVLSRSVFGRIPVMPFVSGIFVVTFGTLTLVLQDAVFIKLKPTIVNALFSVILFGGLLFGRPLLRNLMGDLFQLTPRGWVVLTFRWACFFAFLAVVNELVWRNFSESFWIGFKIWGIMPLTMAFALSQLGVLKRHQADQEAMR